MVVVVLQNHPRYCAEAKMLNISSCRKVIPVPPGHRCCQGTGVPADIPRRLRAIKPQNTKKQKVTLSSSRADGHPAALYAGVHVRFRLTLLPAHQFSWILAHALPLRGRVHSGKYVSSSDANSLKTRLGGFDGVLPFNRRSSTAATA